jgi:hypothetical protein
MNCLLADDVVHGGIALFRRGAALHGARLLHRVGHRHLQHGLADAVDVPQFEHLVDQRLLGRAAGAAAAA